MIEMNEFLKNRPSRPPSATITGNLDQVHPGKLLFGFFKAGKTGILKFSENNVSMHFYLYQGCLVLFEQGLYRQKAFGDNLVRHGLINQAEYDAYRQPAAEQRTDPVHLMIEQKILDAGQVRRLARMFHERSIFGVFTWRRGDYEFHESALEGYEGETNRQEMLRWIIDGIRKHYYPGMIEDRLEKRRKTPLKIYEKAPMALKELLITGEERKIGKLISEGRTLEEILATPEIEKNAAQALVFALLTIECIKFVGAGKVRKAATRKEKEPLSLDEKLASLYREAESSIDRIKAEVEKEVVEEEEPPFEVTVRRRVKAVEEPLWEDLEEPTPLPEPETDRMADIEQALKRKIQEKIEGIKRPTAKPETPTPPAAGKAPEPATPPPAAKPAEVAIPDEIKLEDFSLPPADVQAEESSPFDKMELTGLDDTGSFDLTAKPKEEPASVQPPKADPFETGPTPTTEEKEFDLAGDLEREMAAVEQQGVAVDQSADEFSGLTQNYDFSPTDPPDNLFQIGLALMKQEEWERAFHAISFAVQNGLSNPEVNINWGWAFYMSQPNDPERFNKAAKMVQAGISLDPRYATGYVILGRLYLAEGDRSMAELYFVKALELDAGCVEAKESIRDLYQER